MVFGGLEYVIFLIFRVKTYLEKKSVASGKPGNIREFHPSRLEDTLGKNGRRLTKISKFAKKNSLKLSIFLILVILAKFANKILG